MFPNVLLNYIIGPRLYAVYSIGSPNYRPNSMESLSDLMFTFINGARHVCTTLSPLLLAFACRHSMMNFSFAISCSKILAAYYVLAYGLRFLGRVSNEEYRRFSQALAEYNVNPKDSSVAALLGDYDFESFACPLAFQAKEVHRKFVTPKENDMPPELPFYMIYIRNCIAYLCANTFGRRMVYPGATALLQTLFFTTILENRWKLILNKKGQRRVIGTTDGNRIDTIFFDRRGQNKKGDTIVITCEGNAAFYETGIVNTPLSLGYSVLGWNAPGFAESTGQPTPAQILHAIDAVMQYALKKLGFLENQIVIYAWSIGGFPATWAAVNFPNLQGLILDATFDDLLPLALARMPTSLEPIVHYTVRKHLNLPIAAQLALYKGPIILIRRWSDELLATVEHGSDEERRASNRTNNLLKALINSRHRGLLDGYEKYVEEWLAADPVERTTMDTWQGPVPESYESIAEEQRASLIYHLCSCYLIDFDSGHNTPLDPMLFSLPIAL